MRKLIQIIKLFLWKSFNLRMHEKQKSFQYLLLGCSFFAINIFLAKNPESQAVFTDNDTYHEPSQLKKLYLNLYYAPNTSVINSFMKYIEKKSDFIVEGFQTENQIILHLTNLGMNGTYKVKSSVAVIFEDFEEKNPKNLKYTLRNEMYLEMKELYANVPYEEKKKGKKYKYENFLYVQSIIDQNHIELITKKNVSDLWFKEMPFPPYFLPNWFLADVSRFSMPLVVISLLMSQDILSKYVNEKISGMKELLKIFGMEEWMLWLGWFIYMFSFWLLILLLEAIFLTIDFGSYLAQIKHINFNLLYTFLILDMCSSLCLTLVISVLIPKQSIAEAVIIAVFTGQFKLASQIVDNKISLPYLINYLVLMFPGTCLVLGTDVILSYRLHNKYLSWSEIFKPVALSSPIPTLGAIMLMQLASTMFYMMLAWYFALVLPGEFGIGLPLTFPFKKSFWIVRKKDKRAVRLKKLHERPEIENVTTSLRVGIQIRKLHKDFANKKVIDNLSLDIYHNEITVLLGHNGAGKTITINIITGMTSPTRGKVLINGYNVKTDIKKVRMWLGVCPQNSVHFPNLTVLQHMIFFGMIKDLPEYKALAESKIILTKLNLIHKMNRYVSTLSGGQQRRVSLGMALIGSPQVIILDEPTTGLDPEARRQIWDILLKMRREHTILITTHSMDEADILGDRIIIMHRGSLQCYGTSLFLKKYYGTGYVMNILINENASIKAVTKFIQRFIPNARIKFNSTMFVKFSLPTSNTSQLTQLFLQIEVKKEELGIDSFGVSITTMEDVFLKVGELAMKTTSDKLVHFDESHIELAQDVPSRDYYEESTSIFSKSSQVFWALLIKRLRFTQHTLPMFLLSIIGPILATIGLCHFYTNHGNIIEEYLNITLSIYPLSEVYYSNNSVTSKIADYYSKLVSKQGSKAIYSQSVSKDVLSIAHSNPDKYYYNLVVAAEFNNTNLLTAMFGTKPLHGRAISLNLITNALLQSSMDDDSYSISVTAKPMSIKTISDSHGIALGFMLFWITTLFLLLHVMHGLWIKYPTEEHLSGIKHLQFVSGVPICMYWFTCYIFDLFLHVIYCCILVILMYIIPRNPALTRTSLTMLMLVCVIYGLSVFPMMYMFTRRKSKVETENVLRILQNTALLGAVITFVMPANYKDVSDNITLFLSMLPYFTFMDGLKRWYLQSVNIYRWTLMTKKLQEEQCQWDTTYKCCDSESAECKKYLSFYTSEHGLQITFLWFLGQIFFFWTVLLMLEGGYLQLIKNRFSEKRRYTEEDMDEDVQTEKTRVAKQKRHNNTEMLLVKELHKWYGNFHAVRGLNFGVREGECFGLLGLNGAGKSTTFKMLTNKIHPSYGNAYIQSYKLPNYSYMKQIGYCPQTEAINPKLTARETLTFFAHIRGISYSQTSSEVQKLIEKFDFGEYADNLSGTYSGGNKRKLSTAIALIGRPPLMMLDEPTSGIDPITRQKLWLVLEELKKIGQAIVLSSHSMIECEALCDRLTVMKDGQLQCIGPIQYLKQKYGKGFTIMLKLSALDKKNIDGANMTAQLKSTIEQQFSCELKDEHHSMLLYEIYDENVSIGNIFQFMENLKNKNPDILDDFVVGTTSLEQVFLSFAHKRWRPVD